MNKTKKKYAQEIFSELMQLGIQLQPEVLNYFGEMLAPVQASFEIINGKFALVLVANAEIKDISEVVEIEQEMGLSTNESIYGSMQPGEKIVHFFEQAYGCVKCILKKEKTVLAKTTIPVPQVQATFNEKEGRVEVSLLEGHRAYGEISLCMTRPGERNIISSHNSIYSKDRPALFYPSHMAGQFDIFNHLSGVRVPVEIPSPHITEVSWQNKNLVRIQVKSPLSAAYSPNSKAITLKVNGEQMVLSWKNMFGEAVVEVDSGDVTVTLFVKDRDDEREIETKVLKAMTKPYMA